jgi:UDP-N-acetylglucosamine--N-acetylmuramyl-(pentapeptide) pyrophosphoryl-undecaprenol N-acetylglucosamine transferase
VGTAAGVQLLHIVGPSGSSDAQPREDGPAQVIVPYMDRMDLAYAAADMVLCRAGAMTCAELTAVGLPAAFVPLPIGNGEQRLNAEPIVAAGGGLMIDNASLTPEWIRDTLLPAVTDRGRVAEMSRAAGRLGRRDADSRLADVVLHVVANG